MPRNYYAKQSPRGFANEVKVHRFAAKRDRDAWVDEHRNDGEVNSAACGAEACTAADARAILGYRGDAATESFNGLVEHDREPQSYTFHRAVKLIEQAIPGVHAQAGVHGCNRASIQVFGDNEEGLLLDWNAQCTEWGGGEIVVDLCGLIEVLRNTINKFATA